MARRRKVSFPTMSGGEVSFFVRDEPKKNIDKEKKERAKLKREIVKEVVKKIHKTEMRSYAYCEDSWDLTEKPLVKKAARLAIDLWEKRR